MTDSLSTLEKVRQGNLNADWVSLIIQSNIQKIVCIYCPGHARVKGNEVADRLAGNAEIDENVRAIFDGGSVEKMVETQIANERGCRPSDSFTIQCLKGKGYKRGEGTKSALRGYSRR